MSTKPRVILAIEDQYEISVQTVEISGEFQFFVKIKQDDTAVRFLANNEEEAFDLGRKFAAAVLKHADITL